MSHTNVVRLTAVTELAVFRSVGDVLWNEELKY
jgi:hypothetical protein